MTDAASVLIDGARVPARTPATRDIRTPATLELVGALPMVARTTWPARSSRRPGAVG